MLELTEKLKQLISQELALYARLIVLLEQENLSLVNNDIVLLESTTASKTLVVDEVSECVKQWVECFKNNPQLNGQNLEAFLIEHGLPEDLENWRELKQIAQIAQENNRVNGSLINQLSIRTQNALNILNGADQQNASLYDTKGQKTPSRRQRTIIS